MGTLQLSDTLLHELQDVLQRHDPQAQDAGVSIQYLAAILGLMVARFPGQSVEDQKDILNQLFQFAEHVLSENSKPPQDEAFGIWRPGNQ